MASAKLILGSTAIAITLMVPGLGRAQTCTTDADCAKGLSCQTDAIATPPVAICYKGDGGGTCTPVDNATPVATSSCQPAACTTDADCGPTMVCHSQTTTSCTGGTPVAVKCDPTTGCDPAAVPDPVPATCTDTTISKCIYKYELPCNTDTDCGDNFTCQPTTYGMCTGSTGTASSGGGTASAGTGGATSAGSAPTPAPVAVDAGAAAPVSCTTVSSYPGTCQAKPITCTVAADCPATWTCAIVSTGTGTTVSSGAATAGSAPVAVDAGVPIAIPPPAATTTSACQPPSTYGAYDTRGTAGGTETTKTATTDAGAAQGSTTPPSPTVPTANGPGNGQTAATTGGGGGCSVAGGTSESDWVLGGLAVLGLVLARRRRD